MPASDNPYKFLRANIPAVYIYYSWYLWRNSKFILLPDMSMVKCKTAVYPLLTHWRYCSLALSHWSVSADCVMALVLQGNRPSANRGCHNPMAGKEGMVQSWWSPRLLLVSLFIDMICYDIHQQMVHWLIVVDLSTKLFTCLFSGLKVSTSPTISTHGITIARSPKYRPIDMARAVNISTFGIYGQ